MPYARLLTLEYKKGGSVRVNLVRATRLHRAGESHRPLRETGGSLTKGEGDFHGFGVGEGGHSSRMQGGKWRGEEDENLGSYSGEKKKKKKKKKKKPKKKTKKKKKKNLPTLKE